MGAVTVIDDSARTSTASALVRAPGEAVASYNITSGTFSAPSANYNAPSYLGTPRLTIGAKSLTALLPDQTKTYGANDPALALGVPAANLTGLVHATATNWMGTGTVIDDSALTSTASALVRAPGEAVALQHHLGHLQRPERELQRAELPGYAQAHDHPGVT